MENIKGIDFTDMTTVKGIDFIAEDGVRVLNYSLCTMHGSKQVAVAIADFEDGVLVRHLLSDEVSETVATNWLKTVTKKAKELSE